LVSRDGKTLLTTTYYGNRTVCAWDLATGKRLREFPGHYDESRAVALCPDGKTVAVGHDRVIRFYDLASGREVRQFKAPLSDVQGLAFAADGETMASGHAGQTVIFWDVATGANITRLPAKHNRLTQLLFTPDGKTLVTGDTLDATVRIFDVANRKERHRLKRPGFVRTVTLSPDGSLVALGDQKGPISIWEVGTGKLVRELQGWPVVLGLAFSPDGATLASAEYDPKAERSAVVFWEVAAGKERRRLKDGIQPIWSVAFSLDGLTLITGSGGGAIGLRDVATGEERGPAAGNPAYVGSVVLSADSRTLAYNADSAIRLWDVTAAREVGRLPGHHWSLAFSPDGQTLGGGTGVNQVNLWDLSGRRLGRRLECDPKKEGYDWIAYYRVAFSPDCKQLASAGRGLLTGGIGTHPVVHLWDLATGIAPRLLTAKDQNEFWTIEAIAFAPDGKTLTASGRAPRDEGGKVRVWDLATLKELTRQSAGLNDPADQGAATSFPNGPIIEPRIVCSADGRMLAMNRSQKTVPVWETATGRQRLVLEGHKDSTVCVAFAPDARTLASASWDDTIRLWDLGTGKELRQLTGHRGKANSLVFSADGKTLISGGDDATILFWDVAEVTQRPRPHIAELPPKEWESLWTDLASADAAKAHVAMQKLIAAPRVAPDAVAQRLPPATAVAPGRLTQLLMDLNSSQFAVREKAFRELEKLAETVRPDLERALVGPESSLEVRRRVEQILDKLEVPAGDRLRELRAVEVLEHIGTPPACHVLEALSKGAAAARLTQQATAALQRLSRR